jgi:hypothetical protein
MVRLDNSGISRRIQAILADKLNTKAIFGYCLIMIVVWVEASIIATQPIRKIAVALEKKYITFKIMIAVRNA